VDKIADGIFFGIHFRARDEKGYLFKGDADFIEMIDKLVLKRVLKKLCKMNEHEYKIVEKQFARHGKS
jgi:hypothetical protein